MNELQLDKKIKFPKLNTELNQIVQDSKILMETINTYILNNTEQQLQKYMDGNRYKTTQQNRELFKQDKKIVSAHFAQIRIAITNLKTSTYKMYKPMVGIEKVIKQAEKQALDTVNKADFKWCNSWHDKLNKEHLEGKITFKELEDEKKHLQLLKDTRPVLKVECNIETIDLNKVPREWLKLDIENVKEEAIFEYDEYQTVKKIPGLKISIEEVKK